MSPEFHLALGIFHAAHSSFDLTVDYAMFKFLGVTPEQAHAITSGMMFGKKASLLYDIMKRSDDPKKNEAIRALQAARGAKRDAITHSYIWSDRETIVFYEKPQRGADKARKHRFTLAEFIRHVQEFNENATAFYKAVVPSLVELERFASASANLAAKSSTSPGTPKSKR